MYGYCHQRCNFQSMAVKYVLIKYGLLSETHVQSRYLVTFDHLSFVVKCDLIIYDTRWLSVIDGENSTHVQYRECK